MDEIDAIAGRRSCNRKGSDREIQRTLKELLNQLDGLNHLEKVISSSVFHVHNPKEIRTWLEK